MATTHPATVSAVPAPPADPGFVDNAPVQASVAAFVDNAATNQRGDARYATMATNAGVRVLNGFRTLWQPLTDIVDAGVSAPAVGSFPAVVASTWTGIPTDGTPNGTELNPSVLDANIQYVVAATTQRTDAQGQAAYYDDRRGKGYSVSDGMGPLTNAWRSAAQQTTSITSIPANAVAIAYNDTGNNTGVGGTANAQFGSVVDFINAMGNNGSTEPAKRFYKYARPFRWSNSVVVVPTLASAPKARRRRLMAAFRAATRPKPCAMHLRWPTRYPSAIRRCSVALWNSARIASSLACTRLSM